MKKIGNPPGINGLAMGMVHLLLIAVPVTAQIPCSYDVQIIQAPSCPIFGPPVTRGRSISDSGNVVGDYDQCDDPGLENSFLWSPRERLLTLDMPRGTLTSSAMDISPDGRFIVGEYDLAGDGLNVVAFLIDGAEFIEIPPLPGGGFSQAFAVTDQQRIVGTIADGTPYHKAYIWEEGNITIIEPTFGPRSAGRDINAAGAVVGWMGTSTGVDSHALLWTDGQLLDIGLAPNTFASRGNAIDENGAVAIWGRLMDGDPEHRITASFLWEDGNFVDLGTLPGYDAISGLDLNNDSKIVGMARAIESGNAPDVGFLWQDGVMTDLNHVIPPDSGLTIRRATGINNAGQITGWGTDPDNDLVAFVITPSKRPIGDIDGNCNVGPIDLWMLLNSWGPCDDCDKCPADFNNDCAVGVFDLLVLLANWG